MPSLVRFASTKILREMHRASMKEATSQIVKMHADIITQMSGGKSGVKRRSRGKGRRKLHVASAPGEAPAVDLNEYRRAWAWDVEDRGVIRGYVVRLGLRASDKARFSKKNQWVALEFGTRDGKIKPRPHVVPAFERLTQRLGKIAKMAGKVLG